MAKHKRERALFELLAEERGRQKGKSGAEARPAADQPTAGQPGQEKPEEPSPPESRRAAPTVVTRKAVFVVGGVRLQAYHVVIIAVVILCLCYLCYLLGARFAGGGDGMPDVPAHPTMEEIQGRGPEADLVEPEPRKPTLGQRVEPGAPDRQPEPAEPGTAPAGRQEPTGREPGPTGRQPDRAGREPDTGGTEPAPPRPPKPEPTGPQYRVRIARLDVSRPDAIDALRAFLARSGIETQLETRRGYHVLYSRRRFDDRKKADALAAQVNKSLAAFEQETGRPTSKDAYTVQAKRE